MPQRTTPPVDSDPYPESSPPRGYEPRDANMMAVSILALAVALIVLLSQAIAWFWFRSTAIPKSASRQPTLTPFQNSTEPPLQSDMYKDLQRFQADQAQQLNSYGWIDRKQGIARIPISRAIDLWIERSSTSSSPPEPKNAPAK